MVKLNILCFGNILHGDDGIGAEIARRLLDCELPENVAVYDVGTQGLNALPLFSQCSHLLIVDAAELGLSPGEWQFIEPSQMLSESNADHAGGVGYLLKAAQAVTHPMPILTILGVQKGNIAAFSPHLSNSVMVKLHESIERMVTLSRDLTANTRLAAAQIGGRGKA